MRKLNIPERPCEHCGTLFRPRPRRQASQKYCSLTCRHSRTPEAAFLASVGPIDPKTCCQAWLGTKTTRGYGVFTAQGVKHRAHRHAWERVNGPVPVGMVVRHSCDNTGCIREEHLCVGTHADNVADMDARGRRADIHGERNPLAVLTNDQALVIKQAPRGYGTGRRLAAKYGVNESVISAARRGRTYANV